jgi:hypothetical protein
VENFGQVFEWSAILLPFEKLVCEWLASLDRFINERVKFFLKNDHLITALSGIWTVTV